MHKWLVLIIADDFLNQLFGQNGCKIYRRYLLTNESYGNETLTKTAIVQEMSLF